MSEEVKGEFHPYAGRVMIGLYFDWGSLGRCCVISTPKGIGEAVVFRAPNGGKKFQVSEAYWCRMADNISFEPQTRARLRRRTPETPPETQHDT